MDLILNITNRCNLRCRYCRVPKGCSSMPSEIARRAVDLAFSRGTSHNIGFYGGEPLLEKELVLEIARYASDALPEGHGLSFGLTTNCTLLDHETMVDLLEAGFDIDLSYDGMCQDASRPFADGAPSSGIVRSNVSHFLSYKPLGQILVTVTPGICKQLADIVEDIVGLGGRLVSLVPDACEDNWDYGELEKGMADAVRYAYDHGARIVQMEEIRSCLSNGNRYDCRPGTHEIAVDIDGTVYPCLSFLGNHDYAIGDVYRGIGADVVCRMQADSISIPEKCIGCVAAVFCNNRCLCRRYVSSGSTRTFSDVFCNLMRVQKNVYADVFWRNEQ